MAADRCTSLTSWLDELDAALVGADPNAATEHRLDALIDEGMTLLAGEAAADVATIDTSVIDRVQRRLRAIADEIAVELDAVRRERRELTRTRRAHARATVGR